MRIYSAKNYLVHLSLTLYILILILGSLHPLSAWQWPEPVNWFDSFEKETRYTPRNDLIINFLIYIPLTILVSYLAKTKFRPWQLFFIASASMASLSLIFECLQLFVPPRAQSFVDFSMNSLGAITGAFLYALFSKQNPLGEVVNQWRYSLFKHGRFIDLGLLTLVVWSLTELNPFLPSVATDNVNFYTALELGLEAFAIIVIVSYCAKAKYNVVMLSLAFCTCIVVIKSNLYAGDLILRQQLLALILAALFYFVISNKYARYKPMLGIYAVIFSFIISQLNHPLLKETQELKELNWIPFYFQFNRINHIREILETFWAIPAISFLIISYKIKNYLIIALSGLVIIFMAGIALEWQQQFLQLTSPDITNVIIAMGIWILPFLHPQVRSALASKPLP